LPEPDANTLYAVYFPPGISINADSSHSCQAGGFCAYHSTSPATATHEFYYLVVPDFSPGSGCDLGCGNGSMFENICTTSSHELAEAISDAEVALAASNAPPLGWYDNETNSQGEIGDMCNQDSDTLPGTTYSVQQMFSKKAWLAGGSDAGTAACVTTRTEANDFSISVSPKTQTVLPGTSPVLTLSSTVTGNPGTLTLTTAQPSGLTVQLGSTAIAANQSTTLTLAIASGVQLKDALVTITATPASGPIHTAAVLVNTGGITITALPPNATFNLATPSFAIGGGCDAGQSVSAVTTIVGTTFGCTAVCSSAGAWSCNLVFSGAIDKQLGQTLTATETDASHVSSSTTATINVDLVAPANVSNLAATPQLIQEVHQNPAVTGSGEAAATVMITASGTTRDTGTAVTGSCTGATFSGNNFTCASSGWAVSVGGGAPQPTFPEGAFTISATETDRAGNPQAGAAASASFTIKTTAAVISDVPPNDTINVARAHYLFNGTCVARDVVTVAFTSQGAPWPGSGAGQATCSGTCGAPAANQWACAIDFANGLTASGLIVTVTSTSNGTSAPDSTLTGIQVDTAAPAAPSFSTPSEGQTVQSPVTLTGTAEASASVSVTLDSQAAQIVAADAQGAWTFSLGQLADGQHVAAAQATDAAGNVSSTARRTFTVSSSSTSPPPQTKAASSGGCSGTGGSPDIGFLAPLVLSFATWRRRSSRSARRRVERTSWLHDWRSKRLLAFARATGYTVPASRAAGQWSQAAAATPKEANVDWYREVVQ
jgi:hypothetical protein